MLLQGAVAAVGYCGVLWGVVGCCGVLWGVMKVQWGAEVSCGGCCGRCCGGAVGCSAQVVLGVYSLKVPYLF